MARAFATVAVAALLALSGSPREARAGATVDLLFVGVNGAPIAPTNVSYPSPGDSFTMAVVMRNDEPLTLAVFSLNYDVDGGNQLDVVAAFQWRGVALNNSFGPPPDFFAPVSALSPSTETNVGSFQGATTNPSLPRVLPPASGAFAGGYQMGTVVWLARQSYPNYPNLYIFSGLFGAGDVFRDGGFNDISDSVLFHWATIGMPGPVPEPATAALLGFGLCGVALLRRRSRSGR